MPSTRSRRTRLTVVFDADYSLPGDYDWSACFRQPEAPTSLHRPEAAFSADLPATSVVARSQELPDTAPQPLPPL